MAQLHLSRDELIRLVHDIRTCNGTEKQVDEWEERLEKAVDHPTCSNIIFKDERFEHASDEEIVDELINYKPILL